MKTLINQGESKRYSIEFIKNCWILNSENLGKSLNLNLELQENSTCDVSITGKIKKMKDVILSINSYQLQSNSNIEVNVKLVVEDSEITIDTMGFIGKLLDNCLCKYSIDILDIGLRSDIKAKPALSIKSGNIETSHNFTVGRVDPDILKYLMSRGISEDNALNLFVDKFLKTVDL